MESKYISQFELLLRIARFQNVNECLNISVYENKIIWNLNHPLLCNAISTTKDSPNINVPVFDVI